MIFCFYLSVSNNEVAIKLINVEDNSLMMTSRFVNSFDLMWTQHQVELRKIRDLFHLQLEATIQPLNVPVGG